MGGQDMKLTPCASREHGPLALLVPTMSHPAPLPQEIVDQLIDILQETPRDLATCSLVCRAWLPRTRHHLFRSVSITPQNHARFPTASIGIAACIREVKVYSDWMMYAGEDVAARRYKAEAFPSAAVFALLANIAERTTLESVHLHTEYLDTFRAIALESLGLLDVTELVVQTLGRRAQLYDITGLIAAFPRLRKLFVYGSVRFLGPVPRPGDNISQDLRQLVLNVGQLLPDYLAWIKRRPLPLLRTLYISYADVLGQFSFVKQFIKTTCLSLTHLLVDAHFLAHLGNVLLVPHSCLLTSVIQTCPATHLYACSP